MEGDYRCAVITSDNPCSVIAAGPLSEVMRCGEPVHTEQEMPHWVSVLATTFWSAQQALRDRDKARHELNAHQARSERIVDAAHEYADHNHLGSTFDEFMVDNGLRPRTKDWVCVVEVTMRLRIPVLPSRADAIGGDVTEAMVAEAIAALGEQSALDALHEYGVVDIEEA